MGDPNKHDELLIEVKRTQYLAAALLRYVIRQNQPESPAELDRLLAQLEAEKIFG